MENRAREFEFSDRDFHQIRDLVKNHTGISLSDVKRDMVYSRLSRRIRDLGLASFSEYCHLLQLEDSHEIGNFVNAITTNLTSFFREPHHFDYLARQVIPYLLAQRKHLRKIRIWSAGCSTGEEPYSLAMTLAETLPTSPSWDVKILATDLDTNVLAKARAGLYGIERIESVDKNRVKRWFLRGAGEHEGCVKVASPLQEMIAFNQLNLMKEWPMQGPFDVIFCRNVVIYFDKETQARLFARYADLLANDGYLFVGHSESLFKVTDKFSLIGQTIYQKNGTERNDKI